MKINLLLLLVGLFCLSSADADVIFGVAGEYRFERGMDQNVAAQTYYNFFGQYQLQSVYLGAEYFQGQAQASGQQTLNFSRWRQGTWLTLLIPAAYWGYVSPYV